MQTYGLLSRLLEEGNHVHMAVRLFASVVIARMFSELSGSNTHLLSFTGIL